MEVVRVLCDACMADILYANDGPEWRLVVKAEPRCHKPNVPVHAVFKPPPLEDDLHFCSIECLKKWSKKR